MLGGEIWADDFATGYENGEIVPLFDTTQATQWLPEWYEANAARPHTDVQLAFDESDNALVLYTATYREHWIDTAGGAQTWGSVIGFDTWWRDHGSWPGDHEAMFFDGSEKAKPAIHAWTETGQTHNVVTHSMYPMTGEKFEWFAYGVSDSGYGMFGNAYADGIIKDPSHHPLRSRHKGHKELSLRWFWVSGSRSAPSCQ